MIVRSSAFAADTIMCGLINLLQARHRLNGQSRDRMERYVLECERLTIGDYYRATDQGNLGDQIANGQKVIWPSPVETAFPANNIVRVDLFPCSRGWTAPTVLMLHALMSATRIGYRRWASHFNALGWNACF